MDLANLKISKEIIYIIGIGGMGMSGIAKILHQQGFHIQGSDINKNQNIQALQKLGVKIFIGQESKNIKEAAIVIKSSAVKPSNPELKYACKQQIKILSRADILQIILKESFNIAVTGAHGKTSTTALVFYMLQCLEPSLLCGGILNKLNSNAIFNKKDFFVLEADESDGTFLKIPINVSIITNIDSEHVDHYGNINNIISSFNTHISNVLNHGLVVACIDCSYIAKIHACSHHENFISYSIYKNNADIRAININFSNGKVKFDLELSDKIKRLLSLKTKYIRGLTSNHNADHELSNLLPAIFVALHHKLNIEQINNVMTGDLSVARRFSIVTKHNNITYIDDYAHHPKEISVTLHKAQRLLAKKAKIIVVFEPHKYSRLAQLYQEFLAVFKNLSYIIVLDIFAAGEKAMPHISAAKFVEDLQNKFAINATHAQDVTKVYDIMSVYVKPQDYVLFLGAGNSSNFAYEIIDFLKN